MGTEKRYSPRWHYTPKDRRENERGKTKTGSRKLHHKKREREIKEFKRLPEGGME